LKETVMRALTSPILAIAVACAAVPADAQTYAPGYPVCLQAFTIDGEHIECAFATMAQCQASAAGRGALCMANPYYNGAPVRPQATGRRHVRMRG
jgi:hypothetical protein